MDARLPLFFINLIGPLAVGYALRRAGRISARHADRLIVFNLFCVMTLTAAISLWTMELRRNLLWLPLLGATMQPLAGALGHVRARFKYDNMERRGGYVMAAMLANRGVAGMLALMTILPSEEGEAGYAAFRLTLLFAPFVVYLICFPMAAWYHDAHHRLDRSRQPLWKQVISWKQIPLVGVGAGLLLNIYDVPRPAALGSVFPYLVHASAWLFLLPIGLLLEFGEIRRYWRDVLDLALLKFLLVPLVMYGVCRLIGLEDDLTRVITILSASPTAINAVVTCRLHKLDIHLPMAAFVFTTALFMGGVFPVMRLIFG